MLKKYNKSSQLAGILSLGLGTIVAQSINLLVQPILTRIVTPEEIGIYNFIISMANLIIPIASLKLTMLIVINKDDDEAEILTDVSIITAIVVTILTIFFLGIMLLIDNNIFSDIGYLVFIIPLIIITNAIRFIFISHNNRYKKYSLISRMDILRELVKGIMQIIFGGISRGAFGLSLGYAISPLLGLKFQSNDYIYRLKKRNKTSVKMVLKTYKKYRKHMFYMVPSQFINTFSYTLLNFSVISLFTAKEAGFYSISYMVLGLPLVLISNNVSKVYLQNLRSLTMEGKSIWKNYVIVVGVLSILSIIGFSLLAIIAPNVTEFLFGKGYDESGKYITILCFMFAIRFIASSIMGTYVFFNKQYVDAIFQSLLVMLGLIVHFITDFLNLNIYEYLNLISISYGIIYLLILVNLGFICKNHSSKSISL
ncbi:lipopolysaccharide biosynthesis protein [Virgibacillus halodenitrificans]|uniref:lipopolysaccharide biosynthesis protein n=1 Tax=Virgibacillus halodenitrificans TaxID=1482 RepID=UPI000373C918|nr:oligosaccharide flippase family protein [Virgibacillus halodenitrificans]